MIRLTYQLPGEAEPRVTVVRPGMQIEGPESEVAKLGYPPTVFGRATPVFKIASGPGRAMVPDLAC